MFKIIRSLFGKGKPRIFVIIALIALAGSGAYVFLSRSGYIKTFQLARQLQEQRQAAIQTAAQDQEVLARLKKIILLPEGAMPTMAVITDAEILKKAQPGFFVNVKNNDRLIIYPDMAVVFDAEAGRIIKVGPVQTVAPTTSATSIKADVKK